MAVTPEIKTRFTLDGLHQASTGLRAIGRNILETFEGIRKSGGGSLKPFDSGLKSAGKESADLSKALKKTGKEADGLVKSIVKMGSKGTWSGVKTGALGAGAAFVGLKAKVSAVSATAIKAAKDSAVSLKSISIDAQRIGGSPTDVAVLGYAAELTGTDRNELITQIATISNEFLTLQENIDKSTESYTDFLEATKEDIADAKRLKDTKKLQEIQKNFREAELEARKGSVNDIDTRIREIQNVLSNGIFANDYYKALRPGSLPDKYGRATATNSAPAVRMLKKELRELQKARDEFWASQSPQAQALHELERYGVDLARASNGGVEGLLEISDAFRKIENPSQRARVAMRLFGEDAGVKLIPLLDGGREAIERYHRILEATGAIATPQDIANANEYSRSLLNLKAAWSGIGLTVGRTLVPDLTRSSVELTVWLIKSREKIAKAAVDAFNDTRVFAKDAFSLVSGNGDAIQTRWLDIAVRKVLDLRAVVADVRRQIGLLWEGQDTDYKWINAILHGLANVKAFASDVRKQITLLWNGKDSDYKWINAIRDGLVSVRDFAMDAWKQVSLLLDGKNSDYKWLNDLRDGVLWFANHLKAAFELFESTLDRIKEAVQPILTLIGTDFATSAMFVGILRLTGLLGGLKIAAGLAAGAVGKIGAGAVGAVAARVGVGGAAASGASATTAAAASGAPAIAAAIASGGDTLADKIRRAWTAETTVGAISGSVANGVRSGASSLGSVGSRVGSGASAIQNGAAAVRDGVRDRWSAAREEVERRRLNPGPSMKERFADVAAGAARMRDSVVSATADAARATAALPGQATAAAAEGYKNASKAIIDTAAAVRVSAVDSGRAVAASVAATKTAAIEATAAVRASTISTATALKDNLASGLMTARTAAVDTVAATRTAAVSSASAVKMASVQAATSLKDGLVTGLTMARTAAVDSGKATVRSFKDSGLAAASFAKSTGSHLKTLATDTDAWRGRVNAVGTSFKTVGLGMVQSLASARLSIGGVIEGLVVLGTTAVAAFQLGQQAAKWFYEDSQKAFDNLFEQQAALIRAHDQQYVRGLLKSSDPKNDAFKKRYWAQDGVNIVTAADRAAYGRKQIDDFIGFKAADGIRDSRSADDYRRAAQQPPAAVFQYDIKVNGTPATVTGDMNMKRALDELNNGFS